MKNSSSVEPPIPEGWNVEFWVSSSRGPHRASITRAGIHLCSLTVSDHDHDEDGARAALLSRAVSWIAEFRARKKIPPTQPMEV